MHIGLLRRSIRNTVMKGWKMKNTAKHIRAVTAIILTAVGLAEAADYTWVGDTDNRYANRSNWSPNGIPGSEDTVVFHAGSTKHLDGIDLSGKANLGSLRLSDTASDVVMMNGFKTGIKSIDMSSASHDLTVKNTGGKLFMGDGKGETTLLVAPGRTFTYAAPVGIGSSLGLSGPLTLSGGGTVNFGARNVFVSGILNVDGGTLNVTGDTVQRLVMWAGNNAVNQRGGTVNAGEVIVANTKKEHENVYNLSGGTLKAERVYIAKVGGAGTGMFVFDGGTLQAKTDEADFLSATLNEIRIDAGGATIDSAGFDIAVAGTMSGEGALTKTGEGALKISGINQYKGGTTLDAGSLVVLAKGCLGSGNVTVADRALLTLQNNSAISKSAAVSLGTAAILDLNFNGVCAVNRLSLDGGKTWLAPGTYGAEQANIIGMGTLSVVTSP